MGRRPREATLALHRRILDAAITRLGEHGRSGTSIAAVAKDVGVSKQALMHHFPSKAALVNAASAHLAEALGPLLPRLMQALHHEDLLRAVLEELMRYYDAHPSHARFMLRALMDADPDQTNATFAPYQAWSDVAVEAIRKAQRDGDMSSDVDPEAAIAQVGLLLLVTFGLPRRQATVGSQTITAEAWRTRLSDEALRLLVAGFRVHP